MIRTYIVNRTAHASGPTATIAIFEDSGEAAQRCDALNRLAAQLRTDDAAAAEIALLDPTLSPQDRSASALRCALGDSARYDWEEFDFAGCGCGGG